MVFGDPHAPLAALVKPPPWIPRSTGSLVISAKTPLAPGRLVYPMM
jgi:hypothetical protein